MPIYHNEPFGFSDTGERSIYTTVKPSNFYNLSPLELAKKYDMAVQPSPYKPPDETDKNAPIPSTVKPLPPLPVPVPVPAPTKKTKVDEDLVREIYNDLLNFYSEDSYYDEEKQTLEGFLSRLNTLYDNPYQVDGEDLLKSAKDFLRDLRQSRSGSIAVEPPKEEKPKEEKPKEEKPKEKPPPLTDFFGNYYG